MKVISFDENLVDNIIYQNLLIPVYWYQIPIEYNDGGFNFLEETIYNLKQVDSSLDLAEISKLLGIEDKQNLVKTILEKIENFQNSEKRTIYLNFFQEAISNKLLPIVTKNIKNFGVVKESFYQKETNTRFIKFEKNNKEFNAIALNYKKSKTNLSNEDFFRAILKNNKFKSSSNYILKISLNKISNFKIIEPELVYLHTRFIIPVENQKEFLISSGFNSGYLVELKDMLEDNFNSLVFKLREKRKVDSDIKKEINLPFDLSNYPDIKKLFINIEKESINFDDKSSEDKQKSKEKILINCFDIIEKSFEDITKKSNIKTSKYIVIDRLKDYRFIFKENYTLFNEKKNSIQEYFAKAIILNKDEIKELENFSKKSLEFIERLLNIRDNLKHSNKVDLDSIDINKYKENSYKIVKILLRLKEKINKAQVNYDEELKFNAYDRVKKDFFTEFNLIDDFIKEKLEDIYFYLDEITYEKDPFNVSKEVINDFYSIFEYILKNKIKDKKIDFSKQDILNEFRLPKELSTVRENIFKNAKKGLGSSLGAIYLIYLKISNDRHKMTNLIATIISLRGHGNSFQIIEKQKLLTIKEESFNLIKKLIRE